MLVPFFSNDLYGYLSFNTRAASNSGLFSWTPQHGQILFRNDKNGLSTAWMSLRGVGDDGRRIRREWGKVIAMLHVIRTKDGGQGINLTPLRAIRLKCMDCSGYSAKDARFCEFGSKEPVCFLYPDRLGKRNKEAAKTPMKAIRKHCLWCSGESSLEVKLCPSELCALHSYRMGKNAARKGIRKAFKNSREPQKTLAERGVK